MILGFFLICAEWINWDWILNLNKRFLFGFILQGTPALSQSSIAADLLKGTITKLATEDMTSPDKSRGEQMAKAHVIYEGKSGHILSYDGMFFRYMAF